MDEAAGYQPWSAPHESRSPPTANLRSGRFVRAQARWVAAGVPWSEGSAEALMVQLNHPQPEESFREESLYLNNCTGILTVCSSLFALHRAYTSLASFNLIS